MIMRLHTVLCFSCIRRNTQMYRNRERRSAAQKMLRMNINGNSRAEQYDELSNIIAYKSFGKIN